MTSARDEVLARVRAAIGPDPAVPPAPREYRRTGTRAPGSSGVVELFADRLRDYKATVVRCAAAEAEEAAADELADGTAVAAAISRALAERGIDQAVTAPGLPAPWTAAVARPIVDDGALTPRDLDRIPAVVTGSRVAIAEIGTIILDGSGLCGRRVITLVPDTHICVVAAGDIVETVPEALRVVDPQRPLTLISGPSATSDIELSRVEGVHGPRDLVVIIAG